MQTDKYIQILLSTYNGEKYLREQLDSIIRQENYKDISVLIRDDGSTDGTRNILREYSEKYGFSVLYGENVGVNRSMWILLENSDPNCAFFALSDQDDVWLEDKLLVALSMLKREDCSKPLLFASLSQITDENLNQTGSTIEPRHISYYNAMVQNVLPGHTQVFNLAMRSLLLDRGAEDMHVVDWWMYLTASATGKVLFANRYTVLHRQHGGNAVGYQMGFYKKIICKLRNILIGKGNSISVQLNAFYKHYAEVMPDEFKHETEDYISSMGTLVQRIGYVCRCKAFRQERIETFLFKLLYILGKYKIPKK